MTRDLDRVALVVVDVQQGFHDPWWGGRNNPDCDANIAALVHEWARTSVRWSTSGTTRRTRLAAPPRLPGQPAEGRTSPPSRTCWSPSR